MLHVRIHVPPVPEAIEAVVEGLTALNEYLFAEAERRGVPIPRLYGSGIVYRREPKGQEWWESAADALGIATQRSGDCEDLSAYRAAELRFFFDEDARVIVRRNRRGNFHALVEREDGSIEDPSRICLQLERMRNEAKHAR